MGDGSKEGERKRKEERNETKIWKCRVGKKGRFGKEIRHSERRNGR